MFNSYFPLLLSWQPNTEVMAAIMLDIQIALAHVKLYIVYIANNKIGNLNFRCVPGLFMKMMRLPTYVCVAEYAG